MQQNQNQEKITQKPQQLENNPIQSKVNKGITEKPKYTLDELYEIIGHKGKYQIRTVILLSLHFFIGTFMLVMPPYLFQNPIFHCLDSKGEIFHCYEDTGACDQQVTISEDSANSISKEFELYCENQELRDSGESMVYMGGAIGLLFFNQLADIKGRKISIFLSWLIFTIGTFLIVLTSNIDIILFSIFLMGFGIMPATVIDLIYLSEISYGHFRQASIVIMYIIWGVAEMLILPLVMVFDSWRTFVIFAVTIPSLILLIVPYYLTETPKFLLQQDGEKVVEALKYIQKVNKTELNIDISSDILKDCISKQEQVNTSKNYSYLDLFRYKSIRYPTICLIIFSVSVHLLYYGTNFIMERVGLDFEWNLFYIGIAETCGYFFSEKFSPKLKRRLFTPGSCILTISILFLSLAWDLPKECQEEHVQCLEKDLQLFVIAIARFVLSLAFSMLVLWGNEIFPTTVRSVGMGLLFGIGILGGFTAPFEVDLSYTMGLNPLILLGVIGVTGSLISLSLPETKGVEPPNQIKEIIQEQQIYNENQQINNNISGKRVINFGPDMSDFSNGISTEPKQDNNNMKDDDFKQIPINKNIQ